MFPRLLFLLLLAAGPSAVAADAPAPKPKTSLTKKGQPQTKVMPMPSRSGDRPDEASMKMLVESITLTEKKLSDKNDELAKCKTPEERKQVSEDINALSEHLDDLKEDLVTIATDAPYDELFGVKQQDFTLNTQMNELVRPLLTTLKQATEHPRAVEKLNNDIELYRGRLKVIELGLANATKSVSAYEDKDLQKKLQTNVIKALTEERDEVVNKISVLERELSHMKSKQLTLFAASSEIFRRYFRTGGLNLLLALLSFTVVFIGSRLIYQRLHLFSPLHKPERRSFATRLVDVFYYGLTFVGAVFAALITLYICGDWMLLSFSMIFLAGLALAAKNSLSHFYTHTRLLLNLGEVREGERVVIGNVPWRVDSLNVFSTLTNPLLTGGRLRIPLRQVASLTSRPFDRAEPWFPCKEGDWVVLDGGVWGRVILQSPEQVQVILLGGERKTYPLSTFLNLNPKNLSGGFNVTTTVGLNTLAESDVQDTLEKISEALQRGLVEEFGREAIRDVSVELSGSGSAEVLISVDVTGELAPKMNKLPRMVQRLATAATNSVGS